MDGDERLREIKKALNATLGEFHRLLKSSTDFDDARTGNGWNPSAITHHAYIVRPLPVERVLRFAESKKQSLFEVPVLTFIRPKSESIKMIDDLMLKLEPYWRIRGFHECYYFRGRSYEVDVPSDVVAVELEGKVRSLFSSSKEKKALFSTFKRAIGLDQSSTSKYFRLEDATELAYQYSEVAMIMNQKGQQDLEVEQALAESPPLQAVTEIEKLGMRNLKLLFGEVALSKEAVVAELHKHVVKAPPTFKKILTNRFEVTKLDLIYMPTFSIHYSHGKTVKQIRIHGYTGEVLS